MLRRVAHVLLMAVTLGTTSAAGASTPLRPGDTFPNFSGQTLTGKTLDLPSMTAGKPVAVVFSFSRIGGKDARAWSEHLSKDFPDLSINTIILLESVPSLFRGMALSGIRTGMPLSMQDRTLVMYKDEVLWKERLEVTDENRAYLVLLGPDAHIRWINTTAFTDTAYTQLHDELRKLEGQGHEP